MINTNQSSKESSAVYIHIPFCEHICYYCDFNKVFLEGQPVDEYVDLLIKEMELTAAKGPIAPVDTVFVGGGTPTTLNEAQIARLCTAIHNILPLKKISNFPLKPTQEIFRYLNYKPCKIMALIVSVWEFKASTMNFSKKLGAFIL